MSSEDLENRVKEAVAEQLFLEEEVSKGDSFMEDLGADSLDIVELIMEFEDEFGVEIPDEEAEELTTVGEAIEYLEDSLEEK